MQVLLLGMFVALYLHDATTAVEVLRNGNRWTTAEAMPSDIWPALGWGSVLLIVAVPKLLVILLYAALCRRTSRMLGSAGGQRALNLLEAATNALPYLLLFLFLFDLFTGSLRWVRVALHHVVLLDECVVMLPTLITVMMGWVLYYPIDRRLREAMIFRQADQGQPIYPILSRRSFVSMHLRHDLGVLFVPLLAVYGWSETLVLLGPDHSGIIDVDAITILTPLGVVAVFLVSPLIIRHLWLTRPVSQGEIRDRMQSLCDVHGVRVKELLLWQTGGRMINAAVTGMFRHCRYILLSDGLLDQLSPREIEAVMAHEIAHIKQRHLIWMSLVVISSLGLLESLGNSVLNALAATLADHRLLTSLPLQGVSDLLSQEDWRLVLVSVPTLLIAVLIFGWVSRRIERQADVFAVRHIVINEADPNINIKKAVFTLQAIDTMVNALQRVAELNHSPITRHSWRHGSIAWRQDHLRSLEGHPVDHTPIDRVLWKVKLATIVGLATLALLYLA